MIIVDGIVIVLIDDRVEQVGLTVWTLFTAILIGPTARATITRESSTSAGRKGQRGTPARHQGGGSPGTIGGRRALVIAASLSMPLQLKYQQDRWYAHPAKYVQQNGEIPMKVRHTDSNQWVLQQPDKGAACEHTPCDSTKGLETEHLGIVGCHHGVEEGPEHRERHKGCYLVLEHPVHRQPREQETDQIGQVQAPGKAQSVDRPVNEGDADDAGRQDKSEYF